MNDGPINFIISLHVDLLNSLKNIARDRIFIFVAKNLSKLVNNHFKETPSSILPK